MIFDKIIGALQHPDRIIKNFARRGWMKWLSDEKYLKLLYKIRFNQELDFENPVTFNQKLNWLKLYDRNPEYSRMVDKYDVREYIAEKIGEEYLIPLLGLWESVDDIDFDSLPKQFVLKCTHDSGSVVICRDSDKFDREKAKKKLRKFMKQNAFDYGREWPYKNLKPRVIAEQYMEDESSAELRDYKFFCFNGRVPIMFMASERQSETEETKFDFFDADFNHLDIRNGHPNSSKVLEKPCCFDKMKELASLLSQGIPEIRVDFYEVNGKIYFGELTFFHYSGLTPFEPEEWDYRLGEWIELPRVK